MNAGYNYADTTEIFQTRFKVEKASLPTGKYRNFTKEEIFELNRLLEKSSKRYN